jgi:hypothetical protein
MDGYASLPGLGLRQAHGADLGVREGDPGRRPVVGGRVTVADPRCRQALGGAGISGIVAAYRFPEANVPYVVVDKNADVGGTWLENSYPGCRVGTGAGREPVSAG